MTYVSAKTYKEGSTDVLYITHDGNKMLRQGGSRSWRNNNPGNLRFTSFVRTQGAIGSAGRFAVFADSESGRLALSALLHASSYFNLTISSAIARYAPPNENNRENYKKIISKLTELEVSRRLNELKPDEFSRVVNSIENIEGYIIGIEKPLRRISAAKTDGKRLTMFLIEGESSYISAGEAVRMAGNNDLDAVTVYRSNGEAYLRSRADGLGENNFASIAVSD